MRRLLGNFDGVGEGAGGRGWTRRDAEEAGARRRDSQHHGHHEGVPAWITDAPRLGLSPTTVHYDTLF
jgi:hypothetical protein